MNIPRRRFLKFVTFGTATSVVSGKLWQRELLAYCEPPVGQIVKEGIFKIRISEYPALTENFGSVRLGLNPVAIGDYPDGTFYPFLINRDDFGNFHVLDCECRHESCVVPTFDPVELGIRCACHGSFYGIDGEVLGGPATQALHRYPFEFDGNDTLTIRVPCWGFEVKAAVLPGGPNARIRLDFDTFQNSTYEVSFREHLSSPWTVAHFATSPTGPANQTSLTTFAGQASVYLDRPTATGYYAVGLKLSEV
jgi:nitrite reductase/ring-hydroxylating ferredoxin subunit